MESDPSGGLGGFLPGLLGDLLRLMHTDAPVQWDLAVQLALNVASEGQAEPNVDPIERMRIEEIARIAELQVADVTGMPTTPSGRSVSVVAAPPAEWARRSLESWRPLIEEYAAAIRPPAPQEPPDEAGDESGAGFAALLEKWAAAMAPAMIALQVGSIIGHLARRTLGQYELPLPRMPGDEITVVPSNVAAFASDWSLELDDVTMWLAAHDLAAHAVLSRPHVHDRLQALLVAHAAGFQPDLSALEERFGEAALGNPGDLGDLGRLLGDPAALAEPADTPELRRVRGELAALTSAFAGYVEWVTDNVTARTIGARRPVAEALRRRRVERSDDERAAETLFGLRLDQDALDRGEAFVRGVVERGGDVELGKLWTLEANLPTPAEIDAPGLWIARVNLPSAATD
ncbi:MAG: zinc-dependent metalloprotease [Acidimicrobiales bacterium]